MPPVDKKDRGLFAEIRAQWMLVALAAAVLTLSVLAFSSPVSQNSTLATPSPAGMTECTATAAAAQTQTAESEAAPPTPEEIGYTDGIIIMSTLLILILLVATLREALRRKAR